MRPVRRTEPDRPAAQLEEPSTVSAEELRAKIREIPDFPKPGILFYDITTLLRDPALRQQMGGEGRKHVLEHFSVQRYADAISGIVDQLIP